MKKVLIILSAVLFSLTAFSQKSEDIAKKPLQKIIFDIGVNPYQITLSDQGTLKSMNFALGYEITKKIDLRFNLDLNYFIYKNSPQNIFLPEYKISSLTGLSFGVNYSIIDDFNFIFDNSSIEILAKFGIDINEHSEQESFLYDISTRLKMKDLPYIGIGYNHHIFGVGYLSEMNGIYITFGLEF
jgi:hypothetical protein